MQTTRSFALASLLFTGACASTPGYGGSREASKKSLRGGIAEFHTTRYNGRVLEGRVLLGATVDPFVIDGRLLVGADVELEKVRACGKTELLEYWVMESLSPPRPDEIVTLSRGYWHGVNAHFFLFDEKATGLGPDCFEAELVVRALDGRIVATLPIQVVRTDKPPVPPNGAAEAPKPPPSEAGAP